MKIATDLEQSKKLAEILPLESADMWWNFYSVTTDNTTPQIIHISTPWVGSFNWNNESDNIPCWSLSALLDIIPVRLNGYKDMVIRLRMDKGDAGSDEYNLWYEDISTGVATSLDVEAGDFVDACVEMIIKLKEKELI